MTKLTIVANKSDGAHQQELLAAAKKKGFEANIVNISAEDLRKPKSLSKRLGNAVIWRSSSLDLVSERTSLQPLLSSKVTASIALFNMPMVRYKFFQQRLMQDTAATAKWSIPTYRFSSQTALRDAIVKGDLLLPVIAKPNAGSRGEGILLIKKLADINTITKPKDYVFQQFIPNTGDWRVIVVGGIPLGALYRQAATGSYLNNVSQGAHAIKEDRQEILAELYKIASKAASLFQLSFGGIDIVQNSETGKFSILEVNTAPQWTGEYGFQEIVKVSVPDMVMAWIDDKVKLPELPLEIAVENYYKDRVEYIPSEAFHFASRLWLWSNDDWARKKLDQLQGEYIGETPEQIEATIEGIVKKHATQPLSVNQNKSYRQVAYQKYPQLPAYNALLFKVLFCETIYGLDIRLYVQKHISDGAFLQTFNQVINDHDAVRLLSTHAINYFYLLKYYFKDQLSKSSAVLVAPHEVSALLKGYDDLIERGVIDSRAATKLKIYLLTHAIIGESQFYNRSVVQPSFKVLCQEIEALIQEDYFNVSLDNKLEFLVCAGLCGYTSALKSLIQQEAAQSISWAGNFLVDTLNCYADNALQHGLGSSEHRNVLFLLSQKKFVSKAKPKKSASTAPKSTIGRLAKVSFPAYNIRRAIARVDTGASHSSIDAHNIFVNKTGKLHFTLFHPDSHLYTGKEIITKDFKRLQIKNTAAAENRYAVKLTVDLEGNSSEVLFTLANRQKLLYPVLLGRNFLTGRFQIDPSKQFVSLHDVKKE